MTAAPGAFRDHTTNLTYTYGRNEKCEWYTRTYADGVEETITKFNDNKGYDIFMRHPNSLDCYYSLYDTNQLRAMFRYFERRYHELSTIHEAR